MNRLIAAVVSVVGLTASAATLPFGPGEQALYEVSFLGIPTGVAQITVGLRTQQHGTRVLPLVCVGKTTLPTSLFQVNDRFVSYFDPEARRSVGADYFIEEGKERRREKYRFVENEPRAYANKKREGQGAYDVDYDAPLGVMDLAAAAFKMRAIPLKQGEVHELPIFTGVKSYVMKITVEGQQTLSTKIGTVPVYRVRVSTDFSGKVTTKGDVIMFYTADERQLPVRVQADFVVGSAVADIVQYLPGSSSL